MKMQRMWSWMKWGSLAVVLAALAVVGARYFLRPVPVTVSTVAIRDIAPAVHGVGTVEAKLVVNVSAKVTGRMVSVLADQGDLVRAGQVVATLDRAELQAQVAQAEAALQRARMAVAAQEVAVRKAGAGVQAADATVGRLRATESLARVNAERWRQLHQEGGVARVEMDVRVTEAAVAGEELKSVDAQRRAAQEEVAVAQAMLATLRQDVRAAEAALAATRARAADAEIRSPLDGVVVSRDLEAGATAAPGVSILKIADPRTAWVTVHVDEREVGGLAAGQPAEISLRSLPGRRLPGRVARVRRESDRVTEQLAVDIAFEEPPARLTLGEQAEVTVRPAGRQGVVAVPLAALMRSADGPGVWTVAHGRLAFRAVTLGLVDAGGWAEVLDGLRQGEDVVVAPGRLADRANDGRRVTVVRAAAPPTAGPRTQG